jgi:transglutaminase-like putative cysteine protease
LHATRLFGGQPGIGGNEGGAGGVGFPDPNTQLSKELHASTAAPVLVYKTSDATPQYLQIYVLDNLTGSGWQLFSQPESLVPAGQRLPAPPGLASTAAPWASRVTTTITIGGAVGQDALLALPIPYPATAVSAPGTLRADKNSLMLFDNGVRLADLSYQVTSLDEAPPAQDLNGAGAPPPDIAGHYLAVPSSYNQLRTVAQSVVKAAGAKTAFQDAIALQDWLSSKTFKYTLNAPTVTDASGLTTFLTSTKKGYCQQFSFAMAVLARLLGIPSRVAYGFTAGTSAYGGTWLVTTHDAHAWPELYFQGYGWLRFEPTPQGLTGQGTATAPSYTLQPENGFSPTTQNSPGSTPTTSASARNRIAALHDLGQGLGALPPGVGRGIPGSAPSAPLNPWAVFGLCVLGLLLVLTALPACARVVVRRRRWHRGSRGGDAALAHAAWQELRDDLVDYGTGYLPSESPRALATRATASLGLAEPAAAALRRIAMAEERARYAARPDSGAGLRQDSATVRRAVAAAVPRRTRWRARLMPASVLAPSLAGISQATDVFGRLNPDWFGSARLRGRRPGGRRSGAPAGREPAAGANAGGSADGHAAHAEEAVPAGGARRG